MTRIVYINKVKIDSNLPAVNFSLGNACGLAQAGAECHLMVQRASQRYEVQQLFSDLNIPGSDQFHLAAFDSKRHVGIKSNQWFYLKTVREIKRLHDLQQIHAIISRDPGALPYMAYLKRKLGARVFYQPHNFYADLTIRPDVNPKNARKYHLLEKRYIPRMTALLCLQESQAAWYSKYFPHQDVLVSKPGMIGLHNSATNRNSDRLIGYIGSLQLKKGIETLLLAMRNLREKNFKLLLIGGRTLEEIQPVRNRIAKLGLTGIVEITGWLPFVELESYLDRISVGVLPLEDTFYNRYLTAPNKLFDYLSRGLPIIASDLPAVRDFLSNGKGSEFFEAGNEEGLANAAEEVFSSPNKYNSLRENAIATAKQYLWSGRARIMMDQVESFL